jgi:hypothetical protein
MDNEQQLKKIQASLCLKRDLLNSCQTTIKEINNSIRKDMEQMQQICNHNFIAEKEPFSGTLYICFYCNKNK